MKQSTQKTGVKRDSARTTAINLIDEGIKQSRIHVNVGQQMIVTTEDKLQLYLDRFLQAATRRHGWHAPAGLLMTEVAVSATASFHAAIGVSGQEWEALFHVFIPMTLFWLIAALIRGRRGPSVKSTIDMLKEPPAGLSAHSREP